MRVKEINMKVFPKYVSQGIVSLAEERRHTAPQERYGQRVFNVSFGLYPNVANSLRGGPLDPFYDDKKAIKFLAEVSRLVAMEANNEEG